MRKPFRFQIPIETPSFEQRTSRTEHPQENSGFIFLPALSGAGNLLSGLSHDRAGPDFPGSAARPERPAALLGWVHHSRGVWPPTPRKRFLPSLILPAADRFAHEQHR